MVNLEIRLTLRLYRQRNFKVTEATKKKLNA